MAPISAMVLVQGGNTEAEQTGSSWLPVILGAAIAVLAGAAVVLLRKKKA